MLPTPFIVSFVVFLLIDIAPGDPAQRIAGETFTVEQVERLREQLGLHDPLPVRYASWLGDAVRGDLGNSLVSGEPVTEIIARTLPLTLSIIVVTVVGTVAMAGLIGVIAAMRPGGVIDRLLSVGTAIAIAVPSFFLALVLVHELAVKRGLFPSLGYVPLTDNPVEWLRRLVIPALAIGAVTLGEAGRQLRSSLENVFRRQYILTAYAKGLPKYQIALKHGLKNAAMPVLTVMGTRFALMLGGTVIIESIMLIRGIGFVLVSAVRAHDFPLVTGIVVVVTVLVLLANLLVDLLYAVVNPRLRTN